MNKIILKSPAKINIGLNIIRKRDDGYHDLETIFYPLLLHDILTFEKADETKLESNSNDINSLKTNSISTAIELLENIVYKKYPEIKSIKDKLDTSGADFVSMTGTGSTVYGVFSNLQIARWVKEDFDGSYFTYINFPVNQGSIT